MKRTTATLLTGALAAGSALTLSVAVPGIAAASGCGTMTVDQNNFSQLFDTSNTRATGHNELSNDNPDGLHVWTESNTTTDKAAAYMHGLSTPLADQTAQSNYAVNFVGTPTGTWPSYQLEIDLDGNGSKDGILVGESHYYGDRWWLADKKGGFDYSAAPGPADGYDQSGTLNQWAEAYPDAVITGLGYSLGSGVQGDSVIDSMKFGCNLIDFGYTNQAPAVDFSRSDAGDHNYRTFAFDATATDPEGDSLTYAWEFGDGGTASTEDPTHEFPSGDGTYTVTLTVTDTAGNTAARSHSVTVTQPVDTIGSGFLPNTGADVMGLAAVGALVLAGGTAGAVATRRRRSGAKA